TFCGGGTSLAAVIIFSWGEKNFRIARGQNGGIYLQPNAVWIFFKHYFTNVFFAVRGFLRQSIRREHSNGEGFGPGSLAESGRAEVKRARIVFSTQGRSRNLSGFRDGEDVQRENGFRFTTGKLQLELKEKSVQS